MTVSKAPATERDRLNPVVFFGSSTCIILLALWGIFFPEQASSIIQHILGWISEGFGWYYFLAATLYIAFVIITACSRFGNIKLGPEHSRPDFSLFTWSAMLFAAGIGIDLMFFSVAEPISQYMNPPEGAGGTEAAARQAVVWTLFHYGITGWAMYALMGMTLAYFSYRYNLPLTIRSALYPLIGKRVHGPIGHTVDIAALLGTIFGIATSLGIGVVQLNFGLHFLFDIPEGIVAQSGLILLSVIMATISVVSGVDKGIRRLSELNVILSVVLVLFVLFSGNTIFLLNALVLNIGDYIHNFTGMTLNTFAFNRPVDWLNSWTLFFWAWWVAWAPFVGMFLARISRGRTIRQFVAGTLVIPFIFTLIWLSVFGNAALDSVMHGNQALADSAINHPASAFYELLAQYPWVTFTASLATLTGLLFYVTSADSGSLVLGNFSSYLRDPNSDAPSWLRIFWSLAIGLLTFSMLFAGGENGIGMLQSATIIMGLPFSFVIFFVMFGLYKSLRVETFRTDSHKASLAGSLSSRIGGEERDTRKWRQRLARSMSYPGSRQTRRTLDDVCRPAMNDVCEELRKQGATVELSEEPISDEENALPHLDLNVSMAEEQDFTYQIWPREFKAPSFAVRSQKTGARYFRLEVFLLEGTQGYDIMGYSREQVIGDILDQYERHLHFLHMSREAPGSTPAVPDENPSH